ncbi:hypothetical protein DSO57_1037230, partial [Entomophthora muscae]
NDNSSKPVPGYDPGHTLGTSNQEPHKKGTKRPSKPTKATKQKELSSKKAASKPSPKPAPKPSPEQSPDHSTGGEKSNGSLTDHSFYNLASNEDPTKNWYQVQKTPPKDKPPTHEENHNKPPSSPLAKLSSF